MERPPSLHDFVEQQGLETATKPVITEWELLLDAWRIQVRREGAAEQEYEDSYI